jgi:thiamine biosynthesis lipoprotein
MTANVTLARNAMATRFEIVLHGAAGHRLRSAGEEALDEIERVESQLSIYRPDSAVSGINRRAAVEPVQVEPRLYTFLERAWTIAELTGGAFDPTAGALSRCWGFMAAMGAKPQPEEIEAARAITGFGLVELNKNNFTIRFRKPGLFLDFGSVGKGYAIDRARRILIEAGIENAFIHGGTSTSAVLGAAPDGEPWRVGIQSPPESEQSLLELSRIYSDGPEPLLATLELRNEALSVSAVWGKAFRAEGRVFGHIIDPRSGQPSQKAVLSATVCESALDSDAFSTALLVDELPELRESQQIRRHVLCQYQNGKLSIRGRGIAPMLPARSV